MLSSCLSDSLTVLAIGLELGTGALLVHTALGRPHAHLELRLLLRSLVASLEILIAGADGGVVIFLHALVHDLLECRKVRKHGGEGFVRVSRSREFRIQALGDLGRNEPSRYPRWLRRRRAASPSTPAPAKPPSRRAWAKTPPSAALKF